MKAPHGYVWVLRKRGAHTKAWRLHVGRYQQRQVDEFSWWAKEAGHRFRWGGGKYGARMWMAMCQAWAGVRGNDGEAT